VGNALEIREAIEVLTGGRRHARLHAVTAAIAAEMLVLGGLVPDQEAAARAIERVLTSGAAAERSGRMAAALGGPADLVEHPDRYLVRAPITLPVLPERPGVITRMDARAIGLIVTRLGGGRQRADDDIDLAVGLTDVRGIGDVVDHDRPIAVIHGRSHGAAEAAAHALRKAVTVSDEDVETRSPILGRMAGRRAR
jgi:thymidine phosphorylase